MPIGIYEHKKSQGFQKGNQFGKLNTGENNGQWKGDNVGLTALHKHIKKFLIKPNECKNCKKTKIKLDLANISQSYKRDLNDWEWLCRSCHMKKDGRAKELPKRLNNFMKTYTKTKEFRDTMRKSTTQVWKNPILRQKILEARKHRA